MEVWEEREKGEQKKGMERGGGKERRVINPFTNRWAGTQRRRCSLRVKFKVEGEMATSLSSYHNCHPIIKCLLFSCLHPPLTLLD